MVEKIVYADVETSGLDPQKHGLTQLSGQIVVGGELVESFDLRPRLFDGDEVEAEAMDKTGLVAADVAMRPMGPRDAHGALVGMLEKHVDRYNKTDKFIFVAYNAKFDWDFMQRFFKKCGDDFFGAWFWWPPVCVAQYAMLRLGVAQRSRLTNMRLDTLAIALGVGVENDRLHDAEYDVHLLRSVHEALRTPRAKPVPEVAPG